MKKYILGLITGLVISITVAVSATILYQANEIGFTPADNNWNVNNLESALNDLYANKGSGSSDFTGMHWNFAYINDEETFNVPVSGNYKLEVWGAQGGSVETNAGGYGGYSVGTININKSSIPTLYINVGGKGQDSTNKSADYTGGYNGGGTSYHWKNNDLWASSGGGATHIATVTGTLNQLSSYKGEYSAERGTYNSSTILIVAGGGGGTAKAGNGMVVIGGSAGGYVGSSGNMNATYHDGYYGLGGSQTAGGESVHSTTASSYGKAEDGSFGKGGNSSLTSNNGGGSGGGSGFFGGGGSTTSDTPGGGSGYIGSSLLTNKHMTCYDCTESNDEHIKTQRISNNNNKSEIPTVDYVKIGNGFARITYLGN